MFSTLATFSRLFVLAALTLTLLPAGTAFADKAPVYTSVLSSTALKGYDTVAYFTEGKPVKGRKQFSTQWNGATWLFSNEQNLNAFTKEPESYAPQYGGYCAWAVADGSTASGNPKVWAIVDGKLYVNYNRKIGKRWQADRAAFIEQADANWPDVLK